jgi:hypothetical protein
METLIYFILFLGKNGYHKKKIKFHKWKLPKCEIDDFQRDFYFWKKQEKRRERNRYPGITTQGKAAAGTKQASKEGRELGAREGVREGHGRGGGGREGRRRKCEGEEYFQERHW